jgi:putative two-component system response regulator
MTEPSHRHAVVLVDDSEEMRRLISTLLGRAGFDITALPDGPAALEHLSQHTPAVILLDLMLPGMNGLQVLAKIRTHPALTTVPVVIVTGTMTFERDLVEAGATAVLRKPFAPAALVGLVRSLVAGARFEASKPA